MLVFALSLQGVFVLVPRVAQAVGAGPVDSTVKIASGTTNGPTLATSDVYGHSVTSVGDLNNDGVADLVVGAIGDDTGSSARGAIYIHYMNVDGTIDSTVKIASGTANGPSLASGDQYGVSVASIGDLNNDGVTDLAVGAFADNGAGTDRGAVHIHYMNTDGTIDSTVEINGSTTNGATLIDNDNYGYSVASLGDLNNDGVADLAVGASGDNTGGTDRGAVYIHYMNTNGTIDSTVKIASGTTNGPTLADSDVYGYSVASLGDLNNDGVEDLAVGAAADDTNGNARGAVYIHYMNTDGTLDSTVKIDDTTTNGPVLGDTSQFGAGVASLGDFDGDGVADLVVGARGDDTGGTDRGAIHILSMNTDGTVDGTVKIASGTTNGPTLGDTSQYGISVASLGDLNGDGAIDLVVGAAFDDTGSADRGAIHIHFMSSNPRGTMEPASTVKIDDSTTNGPVLADGDLFGARLVSIGDLNDDGVDDLVAGAAWDNTGGPYRGAVHIHFMNADGSIDSTVKIDDSTTNGPVLADDDNYAYGLAAIGDLNMDGVEDLAVGAIGDDTGGNYRGAVHIHFLNTDGSIDSTVKIDDSTTNGPVLGNDSYYGSSLAWLGDLNNDGVGDLAVGAYNDDGGTVDEGAVFISFMNTDGSVDSTVKIDDTTTNGPAVATGEFYADSVAAIGDLNRDGVEDLMVGAIGNDTGGTDRGAAFIHFLNTDGSLDATVTIDHTTTNGPVLADGDAYGSGMALLGDLNQDGVDDIAVGATGDDTGGASRGTLHIHFMNSDGSIDSTIEVNGGTTNGPTLADDDQYGYGIATIGDLDRDGVIDLAIGSLGDDTGGGDRGAFYIHFMQEDTGTNDPTLNNSITASRLKAGASSTYNFGFTLQNTITGTLTITFPAGFTVTAAATGGACTGGTVGTFGFTSSTLTAVKTGCTAGALTLSGATVTNHSTPGAYTITWVNDDPGEGVIYLIDDDQVTVTANVDPILTMNVGSQASVTACDGTFSGNGGVVGLGVLTTGAVSTSDASSIDHICTRLSTNASGGAVMTVKSLNGANGLVSTSVPADKIVSPGGATTIVAGTAGYALCTGSAGGDRGNDAISGAASPTRSSPFSGASCTSTGHDVGGLTTSAQSLWALSGPSQNAFVRVYVKAAISPVTPAHSDYTDTLTFIGTGTY